MVTQRGLILCALMLGACTPSAPRGAPRLPERVLPGTDGATHELGRLVREAPFTVVIFFSADCACQRAHDARLRDMAALYRPRGVQFVAVDAEATATPARDLAEARARSFGFPILTDPDGEVADALGAVTATHSVVLDASGRVRYQGGVDSDRTTLTASATPWLRDALDRVLAGREPEPAETTSLGCALRRR